MFDIGRLNDLVSYHNKLVEKFGIPDGVIEVDIEYDNGEKNSYYGIEWESQEGFARLYFHQNRKLKFLGYVGSDQLEVEVVSGSNMDEISEMILRL